MKWIFFVLIILLSSTMTNLFAQSESTASHPIQLQLSLNPNYCYRKNTLAADPNTFIGKTAKEKFIPDADSTEVPTIGFGGGFGLKYFLNKHFDLYSGLSFVDKVIYMQKEPVCRPSPTNCMTGWSGYLKGVKYGEQRRDFYYISLPLIVRLKIKSGKITYGVSAGGTVDMLLFMRDKLVEYNDVTKLTTVHNLETIGHPYIYRRWTYSFNCGVFAEYKLNNEYSIELEPNFDWSGKLVVGDNNPVVVHPYYFGFSITIGRQL